MIPGPTTFVMALGPLLPIHSFTFRDFPPHKSVDRLKFMKIDREAPHTRVYYESPMIADSQRCSSIFSRLHWLMISPRCLRRSNEGYSQSYSLQSEMQNLRTAIEGTNFLHDKGTKVYDIQHTSHTDHTSIGEVADMNV
jgi:hypothetical protein